MAKDSILSRRGVLTLGGSVITGALAGCVTGSGSGGRSGEPAIVGTSFEGTDLVVELAEDHEVSILNLIGPDGRLFSRAGVAAGATTVGLEILDIKPRGAGFKHYTPGVHELVAVRKDGEEELMSIEMTPELRIVDVRQYKEGREAIDYGKLVVELENVGTGPTWVFDVTTVDAPNRAADTSLGSDSGILRLEQPEIPDDAIIIPQESENYIDHTLPLLLTDENDKICEGQYDILIIVGTAVTGPIEIRVSTTFDGKATSTDLTGSYSCSNISIEQLAEEI